jgi:hypothetical protein
MMGGAVRAVAFEVGGIWSGRSMLLHDSARQIIFASCINP